jgi:beta-glucanase (GH16 family)
LILCEYYDKYTVPGCCEIEIMEPIGKRQDYLCSTIHYPGNSGGDGVSRGTDVPGISTEFHKFSAVWSPESIRFFVDDTLYHTFTNSASLPFNSDFFLIFNVAMGGSFGGDIDAGFVESTMEVDYVRVYQ